MSQRALLQFNLISLLSVSHKPDQQFLIPQYNRDLHLIHTVCGGGEVRLEQESLPAVAGSVIALPAFTLATFEKSLGRPWDMHNIHYSLTLASGRPIDTSLRLPPLFHPEGFSEIHATLKQCQERGVSEPQTPLQTGALLLPLIASYWERHGAPIPDCRAEDPLATELARQIENLDPHFNSTQMAATLHLSVSQMNRRFRKARGLSPKEYWLRLRLTKAEEGLRQSDEKIAVIAEQLGFSDPYFFSKWFSTRIGLPPGEYRKRCRAGNF